MKRLEALFRETDDKFGAIHERRRGNMECRPGCTDCCRCRLSITRVERAHLRRGMETLPESVRQEIKARAEDENNEMCPALNPDGRCDVYEWRPLACRSFGAPLRFRYPVPLVNPSKIDVCDLNFVDISLESLPVEDVIEETDATARLAEIDSAYCTEHGLPHRERIPLAQILTDPE